MSGSDPDKPTGSQREESDALPTQLTSIAEVFRELFDLLEQYAPVWYTEEHHNKAAGALGALKELGQRAKSEAARSQKAGS